MGGFSSVHTAELRRAAARVLGLAAKRKARVVTAESCTGGQLVSLFATDSSAHKTLAGGFVVYSKRCKAVALGVSRRLLAERTAVSREVALAMAAGALRRSPATVSVAITGVAGPEPDEDGNPVGLVFIATAVRGAKPVCRRHRLRGRDPDRNLLRIHVLALQMLRRALAGARRA